MKLTYVSTILLSRASPKAPRLGACLIAALLFGGRAFAAAPANDGFTPLFNGRDLASWLPVNVPPGTFSASDGMIITTGQIKGFLRTEQRYEDFILEFDWQIMQDAGNSGLFVWADAKPAPAAPYPRGFEIQILDAGYGRLHPDGDNIRFTTQGDIIPIRGATMTPAGRTDKSGKRSFPNESRAKPSPAWNHYRVECNRGEIRLSINGKEVSVARNCVPRQGYICLESEDGEARFKNLRVKVLPPSNIPEDNPPKP